MNDPTEKNALWSDLLKIDLSLVGTEVSFRFATNTFRTLFNDDRYGLMELSSFGEKYNIDMKEFRRSVQKNGLLLRNAKVFLYNASLSTNINPVDFELSVSQAKQLLPLLATRVGVLLRQYNRVFSMPLSLQEFDYMIAKILNDRRFRGWLTNYINTKMDFLTRHYELEFTEIESSLILEAHKALLRVYPKWESDLHAVNICKGTADRRGTNLILTYTSQSRNRLFRREGGGFIQAHLAIPGSEDETQNEASYLESDSSKLDAVEARVSIESLLKTLPPNKKRLLSVLAGHYDPEFSSFLGQNNSAWVDQHSLDRVVRKVGEFWGLTPKKITNFLGSLKR